MNSYPQGCRCLDRSRCQCGFQAWLAHCNQAYASRFIPPVGHPPPIPSTPTGYGQLGHSRGPPPTAGPSHHGSRYPAATTPSQVTPSRQQHAFYQNTIPFPPMWQVPAPPLAQLHAPAPAQAPTPVVSSTTTKRKRTTGSTSTNPAAKRKQNAPRASTTSQPPDATIVTSNIAGVGPTTPVRGPAVTVTPPTPSSALPTSTNPTYTAIKDAEKPKADRSAMDVWWFVRPVDGPEAPVPLPPKEDLTVPIVTTKPKNPYVACQMCLCLEHPVWCVWKNISGGTTSTIRTHFKKNHLQAWEKAIKSSGGRIKVRQILDEHDDEEFNLEVWLDLLADFMVVGDQAMSLVDGHEFRRFALYGRKEVNNSDLPHRTAITQRILKQYVEEYDDLVKEIKASLGHVSFTSDIWSDPNLVAFLAMTAHWCCRNTAGGLEIANRLLAFRIVQTAHDGKNLGQLMYDIIKDAGANHKIGQITLDNASNCDTSMQKIQRCCAKDDIEFDADGNHCRCFPHIINISAQTMTKKLKEHPEMVTQGALAINPNCRENPVHSAYLDGYQVAVNNDPIGKTRGLVTACRASGGRRADFQQTIMDGNRDKEWPDKLPVLQLLHDVDTRWSAMHLMVGCVLQLSPAIKSFLHKHKHKDIKHHDLDQMEHSFLSDLQEVFELPHATQELLSAEKTPTLCYALPAFEILIDLLLQKQKAILELSHFIGVGVTKVIEYSNKCRKSRIYAFALVLNPASKFSWIEQHWSTADAVNARSWLLDTMTAFETSRRKKTEAQAAASTSAADLRPGSSSLPTSSLVSAEAGCALQSGLHNLIRLQSTAGICCRSTPSIHAGQTAAMESTPAPSPSPTPVPAAVSPSAEESSTQPGPSPEELARIEVEKAEKDCEIAREELDRYIAGPLEPADLNGATLVRYWDLNEKKYPLLFRITLNVLPAQASAVPCERMFSSSKRTCNNHRNRLDPKLFEALQFRKQQLKQYRLDFTDHHVARAEDYTIEGPVTDKAAQELLARGEIKILTELLNNGVDAS